MNTPNQTCQIASAYVPPTRPVVLPAAAMRSFYAKAAVVAPRAIPATQPGDDGGAAGNAGGPTSDAAPGDGDQAAQDAFEQILAQGGDLDAAMNAAQGAATETGLKAVLADNPEFFGTELAGKSVLDNVVDNFFLGVTGHIDMVGAGTGGGPGHDSFSNSFFEDGIDHFTNNGLDDLVGGLFGDFLDFGPDDGGLDVTELGFKDPFDIFNKDIFEEAFNFGFEDFLFEAFSGLTLDDGILGFDESLFFLEEGETAFVTASAFDDFVSNFTTSGESRSGGEGNTRFTMIGDALGGPVTLGGTDSVSGSGGTDELAFKQLSNTAIIFDAAANAGGGVVSYSNVGGSITGQVTMSSIEQLFIDDGDLARVRFPLELAHGTGFGYIIVGGTANDTLLSTDTTNLLNGPGSTGGATYSGLSSFTYTGGGTNGTTVKVDATGPDFFDATDRIFGSVIMGAGGDDTITGGNASDILYGGIGNDTIATGSGGDDGDIVFGSDGNDKVILNVTGTDASSLTGSFNGGAADGVDDGTADILQLGSASSGNTFNLQQTVIQNFEQLTIQEASTTVNAPGTFYSAFTSVVIAAGASGVVLEGTGGIDLSGASLTLTDGTSAVTTLTMDASLSTGGVLSDFNDTGGRTLNGTSGQDTITGFQGADTINLGASDNASDIVQYRALNEGATDLTAANADTINQFDSANDLIQIVNGAISLAGTGNIAANSGTVNLGSGNGVYYIDNSTAADLSVLANVVGAIGAITGNTSGDKAIFAVRSGGTTSGIYAFTDGNGDATVDAAELDLLAVVDSLVTELNVSIL